MKKFEKFVFLSDYRLVTVKVRDPEWLSCDETLSSRPCRRASAENNPPRKWESVTRAGTGNGSGREIRGWHRKSRGKTCTGPPDKTRKQPRTRLQLPRRGTNCAAGWEKRSWPFVLHAKSIWTNESFPPPALRTLIFVRTLGGGGGGEGRDKGAREERKSLSRPGGGRDRAADLNQTNRLLPASGGFSMRAE